METVMGTFLDVDPSDAVPIWRQIEDGVRRLAASGRLPAGTAVPSVRELARSLRVNPATVAKAYRRLVDDAVLEVRRGEGTFVVDRPDAARRDDRAQLLEDAARRYADVARSVGVDRADAVGVLEATWEETAREAGDDD
jgi:GntR family transcriptional regulator